MVQIHTHSYTEWPMYFVYVLRSDKDGNLYVGFTEKIQERVHRHNAGDVPSTHDRRPLTLIYFEAFRGKGDALRREQYLKTNPGKRTLKIMLREEFCDKAILR